MCFLRLSPANYVIDPNQRAPKVPWLLEGALIFSVIGGHIQAAVLHADLELRHRLELAMTGALVEKFMIVYVGIMVWVTLDIVLIYVFLLSDGWLVF